MRDVQKFLSNGYDEQAFVKMALNKNRFLIEVEMRRLLILERRIPILKRRMSFLKRIKIARNQMTKKVLKLLSIFFPFHSNILYTNKDFCSK